MSIFDPDPVKRRAGLVRGDQRAREGAETRRRVLEFLRRSRRSVRTMEVARHIGHTDASAFWHLRALVAEGLAGRDGKKYVAVRFADDIGEGRSE